MIDGNQLREEFGRYLAEHKATRWGMDAALMHVGRICYDQGVKDGEEKKRMDTPILGSAEAERLVEEYGDAVSDVVGFAQDPAGYSRRAGATRAALLAHIQRGYYPSAEIMDNNGRGAVPEGWQLAPKEPTPEMLAGGWGYWLNVMAPGKQRDTAAKEYTAMLAAAPAPDQFRDAAKMMAAQKPLPSDVAAILADNMHLMYESGAPAPAEVPMPEPDTHCYDEDERRDVWSHSADQMRTYGDAREAAGYAHAIGVVKRLRDSHQTATGECQSDCDFVAAWDSAIDATRGEVKP